GPQLELVAPGSMINSTWPGGQYKLESGTSMATPFVTGTVALILSSNEKAWAASKLTNGDGNWTTDEVRRVLDNMTMHLGSAGKNDQYGYGELKLKFSDQSFGITNQGITQAASQQPDSIVKSAADVQPLLLRTGLFGLFTVPLLDKLVLMIQPN